MRFNAKDTRAILNNGPEGWKYAAARASSLVCNYYDAELNYYHPFAKEWQKTTYTQKTLKFHFLYFFEIESLKKSIEEEDGEKVERLEQLIRPDEVHGLANFLVTNVGITTDLTFEQMRYIVDKIPDNTATHYIDGNYYREEESSKVRYFHRHNGECVYGCEGEGWSRYTNGTTEGKYSLSEIKAALVDVDLNNTVPTQNNDKSGINFDDYLQVNRTPFEHVTYVLVTSQELLNHVMKRDDLVFVGVNGQAQTTIFNLEGGGKYAVVQYQPNSNHTIAEKHAVLVHEAVHVWQEVKMAMDEEEASREFEAFSVQRISLDLFSALEKLEAMPV